MSRLLCKALPAGVNKRNICQDHTSSSFPAGVDKQDVRWWSQVPTSSSDQEESDGPEEEDFESRGMLFREMRQDIEKKTDRIVEGQEEDSSKDSDTSDCDSDEGWEGWDEGWDEEEAGGGEEIILHRRRSNMQIWCA